MSGEKFTFHEVRDEHGYVLARFAHQADADYFVQIKCHINYWNESGSPRSYEAIQVQRARL